MVGLALRLSNLRHNDIGLNDSPAIWMEFASMADVPGRLGQHGGCWSILADERIVAEVAADRHSESCRDSREERRCLGGEGRQECRLVDAVCIVSERLL